MAAKDRAVVVPKQSFKYNVKQSRFEHLHFNGSMRVLCSGKSGSGKGQLLLNAVTNFWRGCFEGGIVIVARTANLDPTFQDIKEYAEKRYKQDNKEKQFIFTDPADPKLMDLFLEHEALVRKEKVQRRVDKSKQPLTSKLFIFDDISDSPELKIREGLLPKLFTTGRHSASSVWCNVHQLTAVSPLLRKNASILCIFKIANAVEMQKLSEEYSWLIGKEAFMDMYDRAAGRKAPPYSYLTIMTTEQSPDRMFYARFDQRFSVDSDSEEDG